MMDNRQATCAEIRAGLRDYVLENRTDLEAHFASCPACREALEAERARLARLDALPAVELPGNLADKTLRRIAGAERDAELASRKPVFGLFTAVVSLCIVVFAAAILLPALARSREAARRSSAANNMKQIGLAFKMYSNERGGFLPPLAPYDDISVFDLRTIYPEFLSDPAVLVNPELPHATDLIEQLAVALNKTPRDWDTAHHIVAQSYVYTGYAIKDDADLTEFQEARVRLEDKDLQVAGRTLYRLREGVERFYITDINNPAASASAQSEIPVVIENPATRDIGINVCYMDGHVEFIKHDKEFPATKAFRKAFPPPPLRSTPN